MCTTHTALATHALHPTHLASNTHAYGVGVAGVWRARHMGHTGNTGVIGEVWRMLHCASVERNHGAVPGGSVQLHVQ